MLVNRRQITKLAGLLNFFMEPRLRTTVSLQIRNDARRCNEHHLVDSNADQGNDGGGLGDRRETYEEGTHRSELYS
jgi:hypothetical protein